MQLYDIDPKRIPEFSVRQYLLSSGARPFENLEPDIPCVKTMQAEDRPRLPHQMNQPYMLLLRAHLGMCKHGISS